MVTAMLKYNKYRFIHVDDPILSVGRLTGIKVDTDLLVNFVRNNTADYHGIQVAITESRLNSDCAGKAFPLNKKIIRGLFLGGILNSSYS